MTRGLFRTHLTIDLALRHARDKTKAFTVLLFDARLRSVARSGFAHEKKQRPKNKNKKKSLEGMSVWIVCSLLSPRCSCPPVSLKI